MIRLTDYVDVLNPEDTTEDSHGNPVLDWDNSAIREPAQIGLASSSENTLAQNVVTSRWTAVFLPITSITGRSRVRWRGKVYEVDGDVQLATDNRGRPHHHEALLMRSEG